MPPPGAARFQPSGGDRGGGAGGGGGGRPGAREARCCGGTELRTELEGLWRCGGPWLPCRRAASRAYSCPPRRAPLRAHRPATPRTSRGGAACPFPGHPAHSGPLSPTPPAHTTQPLLPPSPPLPSVLSPPLPTRGGRGRGRAGICVAGTRLLALRVRRRSRAPAAVQPLRAAPLARCRRLSGRRSPWIPPGSCSRPSSSSVSCGICRVSSKLPSLPPRRPPSWAPPRECEAARKEGCRGRRERMPRPGSPWIARSPRRGRRRSPSGGRHSSLKLGSLPAGARAWCPTSTCCQSTGLTPSPRSWASMLAFSSLPSRLIRSLAL